MMRTQVRRFLVVAVPSVSLVALAACAPPTVSTPPPAASYGDCILQHVETGMDASVMSAIRGACREKFPTNAAAATDAQAVALEADALSRVAFRRAGGNAASLYGVLYNGNPDVTLTEVDIAVRTTFDGAEEMHTYRAHEVVPPLGTATINLNILPGDRSAPELASIAAARGRATQ